ncbi:MAG: acyl-CoA dehydrogenase family protein [Hyphomonadaceae bacterium]|nr:acyl-CoA dehydrogenase family protein [Hyphomonadaceae bacterium]
MEFRLTDDQTALREHVRGFLTETHGPERLRKLDAEGGRDAEVWRGLTELGLPGLLVSPDQGGLGMGLVEAALIALELGRANVSEPLADTAFVAAPWCARHGERSWLARIAAGDATLALAHNVNPWIADLDSASAVISGGKIIDRPAKQEPLNSVDPLRRLFARGALGGDDALLLDLAALSSAGQALGAAERMMELAAAYAQTREQFGQPIGAFQAIKHHLASVAVQIEFARPLLWRAAYALERNHQRASINISHAKIAASDAALSAAEIAIQVHGAMGYTYEVDLHYWMKRAWALIGAWGDRAYHLKRVDDAVLGGALTLGPDATFNSENAHA